MFPSTSPDAGSDAATATARSSRAAGDPDTAGAGDDEGAEEEIQPVPVRPALSATMAVFAALLGVGLIFGAQATTAGARLPFVLVICGVQVLFLLALAMATRPPMLLAVAPICAIVAIAANIYAVRPPEASIVPLVLIGVLGVLACVVAQVVRAADRRRVKESLQATSLLVFGVVALAMLIVLSRIPFGTQVILVSLSAAAIALVIAHLADAVHAKPRLAPQIPRGAAGVVAGAMVGTLGSAVMGSYLYQFNPTNAAILGLISAVAAVLADLRAEYAEAGRQMAGDPPTLWVARHMQGPLAGFAFAAPFAYAMTVLFLT